MDKNKKKLIDIVRRNLWSRGYAVKTIDVETFGCDLLVEGKYRVVVVRESKVPNEMPGGVDCFAIVEKTIAGNPDIAYFSGVAVPLATRPQDVFGLPNKSKNNNEKSKKVKEDTEKSTDSENAEA